MRDASSVIEDAIELIDYCGWTQGAMARDASGDSCLSSDPNATSFCIAGAIKRATFGANDTMDGRAWLYRAATQAVAQAAGSFYSVGHFNDHPDTTIDDVLSVMRKAKKRLDNE